MNGKCDAYVMRSGHARFCGEPADHVYRVGNGRVYRCRAHKSLHLTDYEGGAEEMHTRA